MTYEDARARPADEGRLEASVRRYPLSVENVGEDTYILMSRGHHDVHEFMRAVRAEGYTWPLGMPTHEWMRAIPAPKDSGFRCLYVEAKPGARGAFPATYAREAYNEDRYEAKAPNVGGEARLAAHQPSQTTTATPQGVASTDQLGGRVRSEKE